MAVIKNREATVVVGLVINVAFMALKLIVFMYSHVNLFFADAIDSFVDGFVIFLTVIFLHFNFDNKLTYLTVDIMRFCQWSVIIIFRVVIFMEQITDLIKPETRERPLLTIVVSCVVIGGSIVLAFLFVDEDDIIKFFISDEEKTLKRRLKVESGVAKKKKGFKVLPMFAEALDNIVSTLIALLIGILQYCNVALDYLYLIDDISNMLISVLMCFLACRGLWQLSHAYKGKSHFNSNSYASIA
jgi:divalent metal cation (Fe/Co/Zn/Cd) transporter